jgi:hypothetical protein
VGVCQDDLLLGLSLRVEREPRRDGAPRIGGVREARDDAIEARSDGHEFQRLKVDVRPELELVVLDVAIERMIRQSSRWHVIEHQMPGSDRGRRRVVEEVGETQVKLRENRLDLPSLRAVYP